MLCDDVMDGMDNVDAIIVCHSNEDYRQAVSARPDIPVIDVARLFPQGSNADQLNGIGW